MLEGRVWADGTVTIIPELFDMGRLAVGEDGERRAALLVPPLSGPPYPLPLSQRTTPESTVYVSKDDGDRIRAWLDEGTEVVVRIETHGRHVPATVDWNVIGTLRGESDEVVVVSSHYDTAVDCPGAVDNASGVAAMAEAAAGRSSAASRGRTSSSHSPRRSGCSSAPSTMPRSLPRARSNATRGS